MVSSWFKLFWFMLGMKPFLVAFRQASPFQESLGWNMILEEQVFLRRPSWIEYHFCYAVLVQCHHNEFIDNLVLKSSCQTWYPRLVFVCHSYLWWNSKNTVAGNAAVWLEKKRRSCLFQYDQLKQFGAQHDTEVPFFWCSSIPSTPSSSHPRTHEKLSETRIRGVCSIW